MSITELKQSIKDSIDSIQDENFLKALYVLVSEYKNSEVVGSIAGKPLTRADIIRRCMQAENDIREGRIHTLEQVKEKLKVRLSHK